MSAVRVCLVLASLGLAACSRGTPPERASAGGPEGPPLRVADWFVDRAREAGLDFVHVNYGRFATNYYYDPVYGWNYTYDDFTWNAFIPTVGILWDFWLTPQLALYPKLETGVAIGWWSGDWYTGAGYGGPSASAFFIQGAVGAKLKLRSGVALKGEVGSGMLKLGVAFPL